MSSVIYLTLLSISGCMCYDFATENTYIYKSNYPVRIGVVTEAPAVKETELPNFGQETRVTQNPNDPKYQQKVKEFVLSQLRIKGEDIVNITLYRVMTTTDLGQITSIQFRVFLVDAQSVGCRAKIWEQPWENVEHISYCCETTVQNKEISSDQSHDPRPDNPKYHELVRLSLKAWFTTDKQKPFNKKDIKLIQVTTVKTEITSEVINLIVFNVITANNEKFNCIGRIMDVPWEPEDTLPFPEIKCSDINEEVTDSLEWTEVSIIDETSQKREIQDHNDAKYKQLATESAVTYFNSIGTKLFTIEEINMKSVTSITTKISRDEIIYVNFEVIAANAGVKTSHFNCSSLYEKLEHTMKTFSILCIEYSHQHEALASYWKNPSDAIFEVAAKQSLEKYLANSGDHMGVTDIIVTFVVKRFVQGSIYDIYFVVRPSHGRQLECYSSVWNRKNLEIEAVTCKPLDGALPGNVALQNPDDPKYKYLAEESFQEYQKSHVGLLIEVEKLNVTRVTTQVVSGIVTRIDFNVIPIKGETFSCHSEIWEQQTLKKKDFTVICNHDQHQQPGGQVQRNPDEPKYKYLADESFQKYRKTHTDLVIEYRELKVTRVTTQVVSGVVTRIDFNVITIAGESFPCHSEIWESQTFPNKDISVTCDYDKNQQPGGQVQQNPNEPKYKYLAQESYELYRKSHVGISVEIRELRVTRVTAQVVSGIVTRIDFSVVPMAGEPFPCHSEIWERGSIQNKDITVTCEYNTHQQPGSQVEQNPHEPKYKYLAEESFEKYRKSHMGILIEVKELRVTRVTTKVVSGLVTRIDFSVIPIAGESFSCYSQIWEHQSLQNKDISVTCDYDKYRQPGGEVQQNPDEPKYKYLATEAFEKYRKVHVGVLIEVRELRVTRVTTQVVSGVITRIDFSVIPIAGDSFPCHSEIWERQPLQNKEVTVTCDYYKHQQPSGPIQQNPDEPKFKYLAQESFEKYKKSFTDLLIEVRELKVTLVTRQVVPVSGEITRIDFYVIPIKGETFSCHSEIWEHRLIQNKDITVTCNYDKHQQSGDPVQQNPDDARYKYLAEESFEKYRKLHINLMIEVRELRVTRVTTQVVSGVITRIDFGVIPIAGESFSCHSKIWEHQSLQNKDISVTCDYDKHRQPGGEVQQNPDEPKYKYLATEAFEKYRKVHVGVLIEVRELRVTRVTTQVVSGVITRIDFSVIPIAGDSFPCHSEIWERQPLQNKEVTVTCDYYKHQQPSGPIQQNPDEPKFKYLAQESFEKYKKSFTDLLIEVRELKVTLVTRQVVPVSGEITRIDFYVIPIKGETFSCHSEIWEHRLIQNKDITVTCNYDKHQQSGDPVQQNPDDARYKYLAEESFEKYRKLHINLMIEVRELRVTRVTTQVVSGVITRIDFGVIPIAGESFSCHSKIWEHQSLQNKDISVTCDYDKHRQPGGEVQQNPDEPKYKYLATEAFDKYRKSHAGLLFEIEGIKVTRVTTQDVSGVITRIDFNVIPIKDEIFSCRSEIWEYQPFQKREITVTCDYDKHRQSGGQIQQNSVDPKYKYLAEESFEKYRKSHFDIIIDVKELKVTRVTTQLVLGVITRVDFNVIPLVGQVFACHSEIWEVQALKKKDISVICDYNKHLPSLDDRVQQNPADPKYKYLAIESFEKYQNSHVGLSLKMKELRVTRVTTQIVAGVVTRIDFNVIPIKGESFPCHSQIWQTESLQQKDITVTCDHYEYHLLPDDRVQQNPDNLVYKKLAEESFQKYLKVHSEIRVQVKSLRVTRVTTELHGPLIRIDFLVHSTNGKTISCHSEIRKPLHKSDFTVQCQLNEEENRDDREEQDPNDPKYIHLTTQSFEKYRSQIGLSIEIREFNVTRVTRQVTLGIITTRIDFNVIPAEGSSFPCRSEIRERQLFHEKEITVTCSREKYVTLPDGQMQQNPDDPQYKLLAEESLNKFLKFNTHIQIEVKDVKVAKVTTQVVSGTLIRIDFHVYPTKGHAIPCHSEIWQQHQTKNFTVQCQLNQHVKPGTQEEQDPEDPEYKHLTEESFETYRSQTGASIKVYEYKVIRVTSEVISGEIIIRIDFSVIPAEGGPFPCHSEIREQQSPFKKEIIVTCSHEKYQLVPVSQVNQNSSNIEYKSLAQESFKQFLQSQSIDIQIRDLKVTKVTTEEVTGTVIRIDFNVYPVKGRMIPCQSEIRKQLHKSDLNVQCQLKGDGSPYSEKERDLNDRKYKRLAEESFNKNSSHYGFLIDVEEFRVTKVTTDKASGAVITQIDFEVIPTQGTPFPCHSEISEKLLREKREIIVQCQTHTKHNDLTLSLSQHNKPGGKNKQNPEDPKYKHLAEESFEMFQKYQGGPLIRVKKLNITKVTTQFVSGIKTCIDFKVVSTKNKLFVCHSVVYERKSHEKKNKEFKVKCATNKRQARGK